MTTIIAIDPGKSGGVAIRTEGRTFETKMPDTLQDIVGIIRTPPGSNERLVAYVENVPKFCGPKLPGSSIFPMAENFGAVQGILAALEIRTILVRPQDWQAGLGVGTRNKCATKEEWKRKLKAEAQRRFPQLKVTLATADALLILDYAIRQERNSNAVNPQH